MHLCTHCSFADTSFYAADLHEFATGHLVLMDAVVDISLAEVA